MPYTFTWNPASNQLIYTYVNREKPSYVILYCMRKNELVKLTKSILCFGDSLTWGFIPGAFARHPFETRWPNAMAARLGAGFRVIEEGLNGRTTAFDDQTVFEERNGAKALPMCSQRISRSILSSSCSAATISNMSAVAAHLMRIWA